MKTEESLDGLKEKYRELWINDDANPSKVNPIFDEVWAAATKARDTELIEELEYCLHKEDDKDMNSYAAGVNEGIRTAITQITNSGGSNGK